MFVCMYVYVYMYRERERLLRGLERGYILVLKVGESSGEEELWNERTGSDKEESLSGDVSSDLELSLE